MPLPFIAAVSVLPEVRRAKQVVTQNNMRVRGCIGGGLSVAVGCFVLTIAVFASVLISNKKSAMTAQDAGMLLLLYGIGAVFSSVAFL